MVGRRHYMESLQPVPLNPSHSSSHSLTPSTFIRRLPYPTLSDNIFTPSQKRSRSIAAPSTPITTTTTTSTAAAKDSSEGQSNKQETSTSDPDSEPPSPKRIKPLPVAGVGVGIPNLLYSPGRQLDIEKLLVNTSTRLIAVHLAAEHVTVNNACVKNCHIWGTGPFTDDSDIVAVLFHTGFIRPISKRAPGIDHFSVRLCLSRGQKSHMFPGVDRNGIISRTWTGRYEGAVFNVVSVLAVRGDIAKRLPPTPVPVCNILLPRAIIGWQHLDVPLVHHHLGNGEQRHENHANGTEQQKDKDKDKDTSAGEKVASTAIYTSGKNGEHGPGHGQSHGGQHQQGHKDQQQSSQRVITPSISASKEHPSTSLTVVPDKPKPAPKRILSTSATFSLTNEPYYVYNLTALLSVATDPVLQPVSRLVEQVLYVENDSERLEFALQDEEAKTLKEKLKSPTQGTLMDTMKEVCVRIAIVKQNALFREMCDVGGFGELKDVNAKKGEEKTKKYPMAEEDLNILHKELPWKDILWDLYGVTIKGRRFLLQKMMFHPRDTEI